MQAEVTVQIGGVDIQAGHLYSRVRHGVESASFAYADSYLENPAAFALAPDMPLVHGAIHSQGMSMFRAFRDCMPDRWGRNLMIRAERQRAAHEHRTQRTLFETDLLLAVNDETRQGAIRLWNEHGIAMSESEVGVPREISIPSLLSSADLAARDMNADIRDLLDAGSSLGGARPKASIRDERGHLLIAKFPNADESSLDDVGAWEHVAFQLAAQAGIDVPHSRLLRAAGRSVLLSQRFDRHDGNRVPYISGLTAIEGEDGEHYSYLDLVEFLENQGSRSERDIRQLWLRGLFTCAIGNTDNHMRNHGFLRSGNGWILSPAFDVNPTPGSNPKLLNSSVDFENRECEPEAVMAVCEYYRITHDEARKQAADMAHVLRSWRSMAKAAGISDASIENMSDTFESGIDKLKTAAGV